MCTKWKVFVLQLALLTSQVQPKTMVSTESSEEYLRKVMIELQQMKQPAPTPSVYLGSDEPHYLVGKRLSTNSNSLKLYQNDYKKVHTVVEPVEVGATDTHYYQVPAPVRVHNDEQPFTKSELTSIYKHALESGNAISVESLKSALATGQLPTVVGNSNNQIQNGRQPVYAYYFYPLKSFMSDVRNNNGYGLNDLQAESTNAFQESQKQMVINPLFTAISSFLGMALIFMLGVLIMPRLFPDFKSRLAHDELLDLTKTVSDAIETYNKTTTLRPKTRYPETIIGIKTRPREGTSVRKRAKIGKSLK